MAGQRNMQKAGAGNQKSAKTTPGLAPAGPIPDQKVETMGRYILGEHVGAGGMGSVRLARRVGSHPDEWSLAIKMVHPHLARDPEYAERFRDEARLAMRINHPYVCRVFEFGESDEGIPFIVMERLMGQPLSRVLDALRKELIDPNDMAEHCAFAARMLTWLCEALHIVHEMRDDRGQMMNIVHRDISPQNIFVTDDGSVRLLDFGIAQGKHRLAMTRTGNLRGKAPYMAPEYLLSEHFDRRIDVWSLGVVFWELLTLETLYGGKPELQTLQAIVSQAAPTPSSVREGIPAALDLITMRALARDPAARFQTAQAFGRALDQWLESSSEPVSSRDVASSLRKLFPPEAPPIPIASNETGEMMVGTADIVGHVPRPSHAATKAYPEDWAPRTRVGLGELGTAAPREPRAELLLPDKSSLGAGPKITVVDDGNGKIVPDDDDVGHAAPVATETLVSANASSDGGDLLEGGDTLKSSVPKGARKKPAPKVQGERPWQARRAQLERTLSSRAVRYSTAALVLVSAYALGDRVGTRQVKEWIAGGGREPVALNPEPPPEPLVSEVATSVEAWPLPGSARAEAQLAGKGRPESDDEEEAPERAPEPRAAERAAEPPRPAAPRTPSPAKARPPQPAPAPAPKAPKPAAPKPAAPAAAAPNTQMGDVLITSAVGPATVWNGPQYLGATPLRTHLPVGTHHLTVKAESGGRQFPVVAEVTAGRIAIVSVGP